MIDIVIAAALGVLFGAPLALFFIALVSCAKIESRDDDEDNKRMRNL